MLIVTNVCVTLSVMIKHPDINTLHLHYLLHYWLHKTTWQEHESIDNDVIM